MGVYFGPSTQFPRRRFKCVCSKDHGCVFLRQCCIWINTALSPVYQNQRKHAIWFKELQLEFLSLNQIRRERITVNTFAGLIVTSVRLYLCHNLGLFGTRPLKLPPAIFWRTSKRRAYMNSRYDAHESSSGPKTFKRVYLTAGIKKSKVTILYTILPCIHSCFRLFMNNYLW